jgi:inorganic pyrophosphatase
MDGAATRLVRIEVPRWSMAKRAADGAVEFLSPLPCPFNYGSVPGTQSADGEALDAVVLGPRMPRGAEMWVPSVAVVDFVDAGRADPKLVCTRGRFGPVERAQVVAFFRFYALAKRVAQAARGIRGATCFQGMRRL